MLSALLLMAGLLPAGATAADPFARETMLQRRLERMRERQGAESPVSVHVVTKRSVPKATLSRAEARRQARSQRTTRTARPTDVRDELFDRINAERTKAGFPALRRNSQLDASAQAYAEDMDRRGFFSHESPEGTLFDERIKATGYGDLAAEICKCSFSTNFAENIAKGQETPAAVTRAWMNSPKHKENILDPNFEDVGYGFSGDVWVQNFGRVMMR